ncbi:MAG TPA: sodium:solute symporter family protein [Bryobacteraceae bacterium]|nr:sodium:solute symporter family protein [Bryobacteraceae bacterium]
MNFTILDWTIIVGYLVFSVSAGLYGKRYVSGLQDFLVAGRGIGLYLGVATLAATEIGTVTFMYYAELGYKTGFASFVNGLTAGGVMLAIGRTGIIVKRLRELRLMTVPEFFQVRYSRNLRVLTGVLVATGGILNMGVFLKIEGTFLATISGVPMEYLKAVMTGILLLELIYTVLGGMVAIVITDFIQFVALALGTIVVTVLCIFAAGWSNMRDAVWTTMGSGGFDPILNPEYGWAYIAFQILLWLAMDTCWQTTAMRTFSARDSEISRRVFTWTGFIFLGRGMMPMLWGIAALAMLGPGHDSLQAMPETLARILPNGLRGIVVAGMLAATMSVNSSYLLGWSAIIAQDIVMPLRRNPLSPRAQMILNRVTNLFVSLFVLFWGLWYTLPGPAYFYLNITATIFLGGSLAAIVGGLYWSRANITGAYAAMLCGALGAVGFFFLKWPAAYAGLGAFAMAFAGMFVGSLLGKAKPVEVAQ